MERWRNGAKTQQFKEVIMVYPKGQIVEDG